MKMGKQLRRALVSLVAVSAPLAALGGASASVSINMVTVGNAGNAADTNGFGSVAYTYNIGEYDVTLTQYITFLNAVAKTDPYNLYNTDMASSFAAQPAISRSGSSGSYTYSSTKNGNFPINDVTWGDAARFCNWLTNGQPTGAEGNGTTETGSYTLNGAVTNTALNAVTRNANANFVIPTENEWYKAAYYNPSTSSYYLYPTRSNSQPSNVLSAFGTNNANFFNGGYTDPTNFLTAVGAFASSPSPYGTFDQGGDVDQWNESIYGGSRGVRGGDWAYGYGQLQSGSDGSSAPTAEGTNFGFRVASQVPEPTSMGMLGLGVAGALVRRRRV